jgi:hypothetical protein
MRRRILPMAFALLACCPGAAGAAWGVSCGDDGVDALLDGFESGWVACCTPHPAVPMPIVSNEPGCEGTGALTVFYDLSAAAPAGSPNAGQSWVVVWKTLPAPVNLAGYTHVRIAMRGSNPRSREKVEVKLRDADGSLFFVSLNSLTDLPVWRPLLIDLREFAGSGTLDLTQITGLEIGITRCDACEVFDNPGAGGQPDQHTGTLWLDELALVNLAPGGPRRSVQAGFAALTPSVGAAAQAAQGLLARLVPAASGAWIPAWFPEAVPNFNSYVQAEALLVLVHEWERTGDTSFRDAARQVGARLIDLQIAEPLAQHGAWFTAYNGDGSGAGCHGNETAVPDLDRCQWVGNVGWVLVALARLQRSGAYTDPAALQTALARGADWIARQPESRAHPGFPDLISLGIEGNVSAYFGLRAAGRRREAVMLANGIFAHGWDAVLQRLRVGVNPQDYVTATDVAGSWGATFLRSIGRPAEALQSQGFTTSVMRTRSFDDSLEGLGDIGGPFTPSVEFVAQAASARIADAGHLVQEMLELQQGDGVFAGARDHWYGGSLNPWVTTMTGVSPTAWMYFALTARDPLLDLARPFSDDPIVAGVTPVRAVHVTELRERIDGLRDTLQLGLFAWQDAAPAPGTVVLARHVEDLRRALADCYEAVDLPLPAFTDAALQGLPIRAVHLREVRSALVQIE